MWLWLSPAITRFIAYGAGIQVLLYYFGYFDAADDWLKDHRKVSIWAIPLYLGLSAIIYDRKRVINQQKFKVRVKGPKGKGKK